ncbi:MAG TPA: DUF4339 domain-containing protein [Pirellulales bacterium]|jgi:hypothetical protein|nr:DUF4339 domain-containing protein [Pirellulales bacterium]
MGIKFYCPNGHKVHVKSFLAGKKGLCPKCGVRIDIPLESVKRDRTKAAAIASSATDVADDEDDAEEEEITTIPSEPAVVSRQTPALSSPNGSMITASPKPNDLGVDLSALSGSGAAEDLLLPAGSHPPVASIRSSSDWYVQTAAGQQYGPVDETALRMWISEGRVSPDDMLWREGWPHWQSAASVFPQWHSNQTAGQPQPVSAVASSLDDPLAEAVRGTASTATPATWLRQRHRGKREIRATLSLVLLGLVVLLFALLLYVFFVREPPDAKQSGLSRHSVFAVADSEGIASRSGLPVAAN